MSGQGEVAAGVTQQLQSDASRYDGLFLLPDRFMVINQAIGLPIYIIAIYIIINNKQL